MEEYAIEQPMVDRRDDKKLSIAKKGDHSWYTKTWGLKSKNSGQDHLTRWTTLGSTRIRQTKKKTGSPATMQRTTIQWKRHWKDKPWQETEKVTDIWKEQH